MSEVTRNQGQPIFIEDSEALRALLEAHGFDTAQWGEGPTKTVEALWDEVAAGESEIVTIDGELVRRTHVAAVDVTAHLSDGKTYRLFEEKQVFNNGSERRRGLLTSLAEKVKPGEDAETAVRRAVLEELSITNPVAVTLDGEEVLTKGSATYDGMLTQLLLRFARVEITEADFNPEGYMEQQADKQVCFRWRLLDEK